MLSNHTGSFCDSINDENAQAQGGCNRRILRYTKRFGISLTS